MGPVYLVVSHLAGAAEELMGALVVNPYDQEGMADSIRRALEMPENERRERMRLMRVISAARYLSLGRELSGRRRY